MYAVGRQTGIVSANDHAHVRTQGAHQRNDLQRGLALKSHHRESHNVGVVLRHQPLDRLAYFVLHQDEVCDRDLVMWVDISRQRGQGSVGHPHRDGRHVLE